MSESNITIPPEALRAARAASMNARGDGEDPIEAACLAMIRAWPGMAVNDGCPVWHAYPHIILPLTEKQND